MSSLPIQSGASNDTRNARLRLIWEVTANVLLALLFCHFLFANGVKFVATWRLSILLLMAKVSADILFLLIRRPPKQISFVPYDWAVAILGTYAVTLLRPAAEGTDSVIAQFIQILGIGLQVAGILSLNRSFGITAANRGIKTGGMYGFVRHPLYLSYVVAFGGYVLNHPTAYNATIYFSSVLFWVLRIIAEERLLTKDAEYAAYTERVRWRLIPGVF